MTTTKISQMAQITTALDGTEYFELERSDVTRRISSINLFKAAGILPSEVPLTPSGYRIPIFKSSDGQPYSCTLDQAMAAAGSVPAGGTTGQVLAKASSTDYDTTWTSDAGGTVTSIAVSGGTTGLTTTGGPITSSGTITITGTLVAANGGTGIASYTIGDMIYASGTTTLSKLAAGTSGYMLQANGAGVASSYAGFAQTSGSANVTRTWAAKLREQWVSVTDKGADPTGVSDSTAAIQAAYATNSAGGKLTVFWPPGTYLLTQQAGPLNPTINVYSNTSTVAFPGTVRITARCLQSITSLWYSTGVFKNADMSGGNTAIHFHGLEFKTEDPLVKTATLTIGSPTLTAIADTSDIVVGMWCLGNVYGVPFQSAVASKTATTVTLSGGLSGPNIVAPGGVGVSVRFAYAGGPFISLTRVTDYSVTDCNLMDINQCFRTFFTECTSGRISNIRSGYYTAKGVSNDYGYEDSIHFMGGSSYATVTNCTLDSGDDAIALNIEIFTQLGGVDSNISNIVVSNCTLKSQWGNAIRFYVQNTMATGVIKDVQVYNVVGVSGTNDQGIHLGDDSARNAIRDVVIDGADIDCTALTGVGGAAYGNGVLASYVTRTTLRNVRIVSPYRKGFSVGNATTFNLIDCSCTSAARIGTAQEQVLFDTGCTDVTVRGGEFTTATSHGVRFNSVTRGVLSGVKSNSNSGWGFLLNGSTGVRVNGCTASSNTNYGFSDFSGANYSVVVGNDFRGNTVGAIEMSAAGANSVYANNLGVSLITAIVDAIYTVLFTDRNLQQTAALTAARVLTLPAASTFPTGVPLTYSDVIGTITATNTISFARTGADTINGATSYTINAAFSQVVLWSDGSSRWTLEVAGVSEGGTGLTSLTQGDLVYGSAANVFAKLAKDANATRYLSNQGTSNNPSWNQVNLANGVTGTLPVANGGTAVTSLGTLSRVDDTNVTLTLGGTPSNSLIQSVSITAGWSGQLAVSRGGTALSSGTSGGILGYTASGTLASSVALTANALVLGGGAGATPSPMASLGTTTTVLHGNAAGAPTFSAVSLTADVTGTLPVANGGTGLTSGTSGGVLAYTASGTLASSGALTASAIVLGGGAGAAPTPMASLGTTTTVLHGNAGGAPTFAAVSLTADVSGTLPVANGGWGDTGGAWSTYALATGGAFEITASSGTFTTVDGVGHYKIVGKTLFISISVTVTTVGSASGNIRCPLPSGTAQASFIQSLCATNAAGTALAGLIAASSNLIQIAAGAITNQNYYVTGVIELS